jgi:putative DNA-invertase from lambdoid prophage Rac
MTAAIYVRVSTGHQHDELQFTDLREYVARMGWDILEYAEKASSVRKRPELARLMADAKLRRFDAVIVWKLDRFARSLPDLLNNVRSLDAAGIRFMCLTQNIDTDQRNPVSRLTLSILGAVAEFERDIIVERVKAGVAQYKRDYTAGKVGKDKGRRSRSGKDLAPWRPKRIFRRDEALALRAQGMSYRAIGARMGIPFTTVASALKEAA